MKLVYGIAPLVLHGEDGEVFELRYSNRGEPFREGANITAHLKDYRNEVGVFLATGELRQLRDKLNELMPPAPINADTAILDYLDRVDWHGGRIGPHMGGENTSIQVSTMPRVCGRGIRAVVADLMKRYPEGVR